MRGRRIIAIALVVLLSTGGVYVAFTRASVSGCPSFLGRTVARTQANSSSFGAVTTFSLPAPDRWPNAVTVAPDGSVWFGEEAVPALAHLYVTNGTLVEYSFPGTYPAHSSQGYSCADKTDIWGVAIWNGRVWATDSAQNRLVGLSPANDTFKVVSLAASGSFPYTLTPGPDDALWFTQIRSGQIGTLFANGTVVEHSVQIPQRLNGTPTPVQVPGVPAQIVFANSSTGYYVDASPIINGSPVFSFDPGHFSPKSVGAAGNQSLSDPDSIAVGDGGIWLAQHGDSSLAFYDVKNSSWTVYPNSSVGYIGTTLPYFVETNGSLVWFNEHFGNRMAMVDVQNKTLTEYSLSDPAAGNMSQIKNALTFDLGGGRAWFTEATADAAGFVDTSYRPTFSISADNSSLSIQQARSASMQVDLRGNSSSPISIQLSESESANLTGTDITMQADKDAIGSLSGNQILNVTVDVGPGAPPGRYTLLVTATDGLVSCSSYVELTVLP